MNTSQRLILIVGIGLFLCLVWSGSYYGHSHSLKVLRIGDVISRAIVVFLPVIIVWWALKGVKEPSPLIVALMWPMRFVLKHWKGLVLIAVLECLILGIIVGIYLSFQAMQVREAPKQKSIKPRSVTQNKKLDCENVECYRKAAEQGNAEAQFILGIFYMQGLYVPHDDGEAAKWFYRAAKQGNRCAQNELGRIYSEGRGAPKDCEEAFKWYRKAAEQGLMGAQYEVGRMYASGKGIPQDCGEAVKWYRKAAEQGYYEAKMSLGVMFENGQGVPQDYVEAIKWYRKLAEYGNGEAQFKLGRMYGEGQGVPKDIVIAHMWFDLATSSNLPSDRIKEAKDLRNKLEEGMTKEQIITAQRMAWEWKPKPDPRDFSDLGERADVKSE